MKTSCRQCTELLYPLKHGISAQQPEVMSDISGLCMYDILHYAYEHLEESKLILCCSEGTKFSKLIDEMVEIETNGTHAYQDVLRRLG